MMLLRGMPGNILIDMTDMGVDENQGAVLSVFKIGGLRIASYAPADDNGEERLARDVKRLNEAGIAIETLEPWEI